MQQTITWGSAAPIYTVQEVSNTSPGWVGFGAKELEILGQFGSAKAYAKGSVVISEGDEALALYVMLTGRAKVYTTARDGREIILRLLGPGEYFGELSLLDGALREASVKVSESSRLLTLSKSKFADCLESYPNLYRKLLRDLSCRVRQVSDDLSRVASLDVYQRVARLLMDLAICSKDGWVVTMRLTQQDLANRICASREMVSRVLQGLVAGGYITLDRRQIVIRKKLPENW